jgi:hypothetical protein
MPDDLGWELVTSIGDGLHGAALPRTVPGRPPSCDKALLVAIARTSNESHDQPRQHLGDFVQACNFARRLKTLKGLTPYEFICNAWTTEPQRFTLNPLHQMPGLNI